MGLGLLPRRSPKHLLVGGLPGRGGVLRLLRRSPRLLRRSRPGHPPIRDLHPRRTPTPRRNKVLKRALFLSEFAALSDPVSRAYYAANERSRKKHNAALIALARADVLYAMLRDNKPYAQSPAAAA